MWARNGVDIGYNTPYHSQTLHCHCSRLWKIQETGTYPHVCHVFYVEMIWEVRFNTTWLAAMENVWDSQLFFLHILNPYQRKDRGLNTMGWQLWAICGNTSCSLSIVNPYLRITPAWAGSGGLSSSLPIAIQQLLLHISCVKVSLPSFFFFKTWHLKWS